MNYLAGIAINNSKPMYVKDSLKIPYMSKMAGLVLPTIIKIVFLEMEKTKTKVAKTV